MKNLIRGILAISLFVLAEASQAAVPKAVLADESLLNLVGISPTYSNALSNVAIAVITEKEELALSKKAHELGRCGGYELLQETPTTESAKSTLMNLLKQQEKSFKLLSGEVLPTVAFNPVIEQALQNLQSAKLNEHVLWISNFPSRFNKAARPNTHVEALKQKIEALLINTKLPWQITFIDHNSTKQKSLRLRFQGSRRAGEVVVLGAHFDSINQAGFFPNPSAIAPGADDNASGSANLLEAVRVFSEQEQAERSVEFFWYAGEESGLLGSAEIAKQYRAQGVDVVAVLQLDMSLFPGQGKFVFSSMTDFTSEWLRSYLLQINDLYVKANIQEDKCGYGCSDHASWFRQGYATLMPFEANMNTMNRNIHTEQDRINSSLDFEHSHLFSKIALVFAMDLGTSLQRPLMNTELPQQSLAPVSSDRRRCLTPLGLALDRTCMDWQHLF